MNTGLSVSTSLQEEGRSFLTIDNLRTYLELKGFSILFDEVTHDLFLEDKYDSLPPNKTLSALGTYLFSTLRTEGLYKGASLQTIESFLSFIAAERPFNPVSEILKRNAWDKKDRLLELYEILHIPESDTLSRTLIRKWLLQAIAVCCHNDCSDPFGADGVLTLCGPQGIGKTSLVSKLGMYSKLCKLGVELNPRDKDSVINATSCFLCELGEVESTIKRDVPALKAFLTNSIDNFRPPYGRASEKHLRHTTYIATCNSKDFLLDVTGNRRFWTIPCEHMFDLERLTSFDAIQLWAQIEDELSCKGVQCFRLTRNERNDLEKRNRGYFYGLKAQAEIEDILAQAQANPERYETRLLTVSDFAGYYSELNRYDSRTIGKALEACGIPQQRNRSGRLRKVPVPIRR